MAFYEPTVLEFHVLLVDHNTKNLVETCKLLQLNLYKVTPIQDASVASLMLREGNSKFDLVMVDEYSFNMRGFNIIEDATKLDLPVAIMSSNANAMLAKRAIEEGAFLIMEKPIIAEDFKYLWQNVLRENVQKSKENQGRGKTCIDNQNYPQTENLIENNTTTTNMTPLNNTCGSSKNKGKKGRNVNIINPNSNNNTRGQCMKPKLCTEWTQELHEKFMAAVKQLGDGKCFPKEILEIMNVPGLTRMQVASHLQKCRYGPQRPERQTLGSKVSKSANNTNSKRSNSRRYGSFPSLIKGFKSNQNEEQGLNSNMEYLTPSNNMGQDGIFENLSNNNFMIDQNALDLGLQSDVLYGFASADNDGLIQNNFNFQGSDSDQVVSTQTSEAANQVDPSFWTAWIANLASDDLENGKA